MSVSRRNRDDLAFLVVYFSVAIAGALLGLSPWIVLPLGLVLGMAAGQALRRHEPEPAPADPSANPLARIAVDFASALVDGDFAKARSLLTDELQQTLTPERLRSELYGMFRGYAEGHPTGIWYEEGCAHEEDWPARRPGEVGWVYVGIHGDDFSEAVTVTITRIDDAYRICDVEWGRP